MWEVVPTSVMSEKSPVDESPGCSDQDSTFPVFVYGVNTVVTDGSDISARMLMIDDPSGGKIQDVQAS